MGIGIVAAAIPDFAHTIRTANDGVTTIETPARRDYWFGHGYRLSFTPSARDLRELRHRGQRLFGAMPGMERFTIVWENEDECLSEDLSDESIEITNVFCFRPKTQQQLDPRVFPISSPEHWNGVERLIAEEAEPRLTSFNHWVVSSHRDAVADGRAEFFGLQQSGELIAFVGAYFDGALGRFATPFTLVRQRGKGLFGVCVQWLFAAARSRGVERMILATQPQGYQERLYIRLGAQPVSRLYADIVNTKAG